MLTWIKKNRNVVLLPNIRMEQTSAFVTVFAGRKVWGGSRAKTRAKPAYDRMHRQLIRGVRHPKGGISWNQDLRKWIHFRS